MTDRVAELIDIIRANISTDSDAARRSVDAAQRKCAVAFGKHHGWKLSSRYFALAKLSSLPKRELDPGWGIPRRYDSLCLDHPFYFRDAWGPVAIAAHLYDGDHKDARVIAFANQLGIAVQLDMGDWMTSIFGIGPVISAGLLAHIDMEWMECSACRKKETAGKPCKCGAPFVRKILATAGQLWRFAGVDPTTKWLPKTRRPWNAQLKVIAVYKAGESFVKFHKNERCFYGHLWKRQKDIYIARNEAGDYAERSAQSRREEFPQGASQAGRANQCGRASQGR